MLNYGIRVILTVLVIITLVSCYHQKNSYANLDLYMDSTHVERCPVLDKSFEELLEIQDKGTTNVPADTDYKTFKHTFVVCGNTHPKNVWDKVLTSKFIQKGEASWYGLEWHGKKTANGETYNMNAMTAAHKTLPIGSLVKVTNLKNHKSVVVRINDRGPYVKGRIIDLSKKAKQKLEMGDIGPVKIELVNS